MHQIHFMLLAINGVPVPKEQQQLLDMVQVPYGTGSAPYPSVTVRMDFRGPDVGDFVYHCHILAHEDGGMMAIIRVVPRDAGWFGPYGKFRTLFASIGWPYAEKTAAWCVNGRTVERDRDSGIEQATASPGAARRRSDFSARDGRASGDCRRLKACDPNAELRIDSELRSPRRSRFSDCDRRGHCLARATCDVAVADVSSRSHAHRPEPV